MVLFSSLVAYLLAHVSSSTRNWNFVCSTIKWKHRHHFTRVIWQISSSSSSSSRNSKRIGVTLIALDRKAASEWALLKICWTWVVEMIVVWIWKAMKWYGECVCTVLDTQKNPKTIWHTRIWSPPMFLLLLLLLLLLVLNRQTACGKHVDIIIIVK